MALSNYTSTTDFINEFLEYGRPEHTDFDYANFTSIIKYLQVMTIFEEPNLESHVKNKITSYLMNKGLIIPYGTIKKAWLYPIQYCPICLLESTSYFKSDWRISLIFGCLKCKCYLVNNCPNCHMPIQILKIKPQDNSEFNQINNCFSCSRRLIGPITFLKDQELNALKQVSEWIKLSNTTIESNFQLLIDLILIISSKGKVGKKVRFFFGLGSGMDNFLTLSQQQRSKLIILAIQWMDNFFVTLLRMNKETGLNAKDWHRVIDLSNLPIHP